MVPNHKCVIKYYYSFDKEVIVTNKTITKE